MRRAVYTTLVASLMLSLLFAAQLSTKCANATGEGFETNITNDTLPQGDPAIFGNRVVWSEKTIEGNWEIFLCDLSNDTDGDFEKIQITYNSSNQIEPDIYGDIIVWEDGRNGYSDIYMYNLAEDSDGNGVPNYLEMDRPYPDPAEIRITDNPSYEEEPAIYGTKIIWKDKTTGDTDVRIYDMISRKEAIIGGFKEVGTPDPINPEKIIYPSQINPSIYGNKVVWQDNRLGKNEIYMYNLSVDSDGDGVPNYLDDDRSYPDPAEKRITNNSEDDIGPSIYGDLIVYTRMKNNDPKNVFLYDIRTEAEYRLTNSTSNQKIDGGLCDIYGAKVVWVYDTGSKDVYLYDLANDSDDDGMPNYIDDDDDNDSILDENDTDSDPALIRITNESEPEPMIPAIYTNKIVWQDRRDMGKHKEIYLYTLTENLPPEITYSMPNYTSKVKSGESIVFNVTASDPESGVNYTWFLDDVQLPEENANFYEFHSDYESAGVHEVKVVVSDGEYPVEVLWLLYAPKITKFDPVINPAIVEGEKITISLRAKGLDSQTVDISWEWDENLIPEPHILNTTLNGEVYAELEFSSQLDYNGSDYIERFNISVEVMDGTYKASHRWILTVLYFNDADMDGYNDDVEIDSGSDPLNRTNTPTDLDKDFIVDAKDKDKDGDGFLDKYDDYPLNPKKQFSGKHDYSFEILVIIITLVLVIAAIITSPRILKS